jgi:Tfp pilus assembly protein PilN
MIEINLAPGAQSRKSSGRARTGLKMPAMPAFAGDARTGVIGVAGVLLLLVLGFAFWRQGATKSSLETRIEREVTDSTRFATTIGLISALQARQDTIERKIEVIRSVDQRRYVWPHLLDEISRSVPVYTWLTSITSTEEAPPAPQAVPADTGAAAEAAPPPRPIGPAFSVQGNSGSTQALTRLMKNLEASPFIREVTLVTSEQAEVEGRAIHRFTLEARYEIPHPSAIQTVPVVITN